MHNPWISRANRVRTIAFPPILFALGARRDVYDSHKWYTQAGVISITGEKFFNWNTAAGGGGAIDLVMHIRNTDFISALTWLCTQFPATAIEKTHAPPLQYATAVVLPKRNDAKLSQVFSWLTKIRALPETLVSRLIDSGMLYADLHANAVFLLLGKKNQIVGAELRGTQKIKWHALSKGSNKNLGCFAIRSSPVNTIVLCESAIDACSYHSLYPQDAALSTAGAHPNPQWLHSLISKNYALFCGFDADPTGDAMAQKMIERYPVIKRLRPPLHDWNDVLVHSKTS